jgi:hypothetical protein
MPKTNKSRYTDPRRGTRTVQESSRLIGCGDGSTRALMDKGILDHIKIGNRNQPTVAGLERLLGKSISELEGHASPAGDPPAAPNCTGKEKTSPENSPVAAA